VLEKPTYQRQVAFVCFIWDNLVYFFDAQVCDDTNQAKGFALLGTSGGIARLMVSIFCHSAHAVDFLFCRALWLGGSWLSLRTSTRCSRLNSSVSIRTVCPVSLVGYLVPSALSVSSFK